MTFIIKYVKNSLVRRLWRLASLLKWRSAMSTEQPERVIALQKAGVAREVLRYFIVERGMLKLGSHTRRDIGNIAQAIDVPLMKIEQVLYPIFRDMLGGVFPKSQNVEDVFNISIETGEISHKILKHFLHRVNAPSVEDRQMINIAREICFPLEMVTELLDTIYNEIVTEIYDDDEIVAEFV